MNKKGISKKNLEYLEQFENHIAPTVTDITRRTQLCILSKFARALQIRKMIFIDVTIDDINWYFKDGRAKVGRKAIVGDNSIGHEKVVISKFFKWLGKPEIAIILKSRKRKARIIKLKEVLTEDEITKIVSATRTERDKAMLKFLADTGCRIGELLNMKVGDIDFSIDPPLATLDGKTGPRNVPLFTCANTVKKYLETEHPFKNQQEKPLWITDSRTKGIRPISYSYTVEMLKRAVARAGIKKRVYIHLFRHSRATELAKRNLPTNLMNKQFGWSRTSNTASIYTHSTQRDLIDALERAYNKKPSIRTEPSKLEDIKCQRCSEMNPVENKFCSRCNFPLDIKVSIKETMIIELLRSQFYKSVMEDAKSESEPIDIHRLAEQYDELLVESKKPGRKKISPNQK